MAYKFILAHQMKTLLNDVEDKQKKDIKDYTSGHLNESVHLRKQAPVACSKWASAHSEPIYVNKFVKPCSKPRFLREAYSPKDALYNFALGASGVFPNLSSTKSDSKNYRKQTDIVASEANKQLPPTQSAQSLYSYLGDGVLVEELPTYGNIVLDRHISLTSRVTDNTGQISAIENNTETPQQTNLSQKVQLESPRLVHKHSALQVLNHGITKKDQYRQKKVTNSVLLPRKRVYKKLNFLAGEQTAVNNEQKFQEKLEHLRVKSPGVNFHYLSACQNVLNDIMKESPSFTHILNHILNEYDNYINKLLAGQTTQKLYLQSQVNLMVTHGTSRPKMMADASEYLKYLETEAKTLLDINQRLNNEVKTEYENLSQGPEITVKKPNTKVYIERKQPMDLSLELENMKALILETMDELNVLRLKTRAEYVPVPVCTHLEQCIKETEVEVQKLLKQNEYFERSVAEMQRDLEQSITEADTSEKDARRIWRKVNSNRGLPGLPQLRGAQSDDDDDDDDESKWNWYIS